MAKESWAEMRKSVIDGIITNNQNYSKLNGIVNAGFQNTSRQIETFRLDMFKILQGDPADNSIKGVIPRIVDIEKELSDRKKKDKRKEIMINGITIAVLAKIVYDFLVQLR